MKFSNFSMFIDIFEIFWIYRNFWNSQFFVIFEFFFGIIEFFWNFRIFRNFLGFSKFWEFSIIFEVTRFFDFFEFFTNFRFFFWFVRNSLKFSIIFWIFNLNLNVLFRMKSRVWFADDRKVLIVKFIIFWVGGSAPPMVVAQRRNLFILDLKYPW